MSCRSADDENWSKIPTDTWLGPIISKLTCQFCSECVQKLPFVARQIVESTYIQKATETVHASVQWFNQIVFENYRTCSVSQQRLCGTVAAIYVPVNVILCRCFFPLFLLYTATLSLHRNGYNVYFIPRQFSNGLVLWNVQFDRRNACK